MRLIRLRLRNFRQHADTEIHFRPGLTGIIGPNGAGKSTILEGIAWAVYGASAARGTNETIRFARAAPRSRVEVEVEFALGGHEYRVVRSLNSAEVYLDGGAAPVAATLGGATAYLQGRIGMSREEFFNTYFTGQKELQFLAAMGSTERGRFLSQVLGYERLRRAQDLARTRRNELRHEIKGLRSALGDLDEIVAARMGAQGRMAEALAARSTAETTLVELGVVVRQLAPRWQEAQATRERHRELTHAVENAARDRDAARRDVLRAEAELERVAQAERELAPLREQLAEMPAVAAESEGLAKLAQQDERRKALVRQLAEMDTELERSAERLAKLEQAPELERQYAEELEQLRAERAGVERELEEQKTAWLRDRQDAQTKLQNYRDRGNELREQIRQIRELGPEGKCPTCGRPVGDDYERLLDEMEEQWVSIVQDGKWWKSRADQLDAKPEEVAALEGSLRSLSEQVEDKTRKHTRCRAAVDELKLLGDEQAKRVARREELRAELEGVPAGYDRERHREVEARLGQLRDVERRAVRLEEAATRRPAWERDRMDAGARETTALERGQATTAERDALGFSEDAFAALRGEYEGASERYRTAELRVTELRGHVATAEQALQTAQRDEAEYHQRAGEVVERETDLRYHEELDLAYSELRAELNAQVRPELSEIASAFLAQLTDGRYTSMEIDDAYNLMVLDEGEEKPVISGGEEDIANLVLRLSLSQMIAERAGHPLSLLILDEVFGSLDVARRDNVVQLLHHLEDRFEQVILITHIEGIRESLDQVLRVDFDERTGTATVREESFSGEDLPEPGMAAD
ncbi:MAG: SMC family ATPase [Gemmatimonadetes bacterium]|nr:SMC family ATPase [Gemmatimonadota bacterium]